MMNQLQELLYYTRVLEILMAKDGATGFSFSDKVKSYDDGPTEDLSLYASEYYYKEGNYYRKGTDWEHERIFYKRGNDIDLDDYRKFKSYKDTLSDGHYPELIEIGHERNQLMHIDGYKIPDYTYTLLHTKIKRTIDYFQDKKNISIVDEDYKKYEAETNPWVKKQEKKCQEKAQTSISNVSLFKNENLNTLNTSQRAEMQERYDMQGVFTKHVLDLKILWVKFVLGIILGFVTYNLLSFLHYNEKVTIGAIIVLSGIILLTIHHWIEGAKTVWWSSSAFLTIFVNILILVAAGYLIHLLTSVLGTKPGLLAFINILFTLIVLALLFNTALLIEFLIDISKMVLYNALMFGVPFALLIWFIMPSNSNNIPKGSSSHEKKTYSSKTYATEDKTKVKNTRRSNSGKSTKSNTCNNYYVNANSLNLRSSASSNSTVMKKLKRNAKVCITDTQGSWSYVENSGWVASKFLTKKLKKTQTKKKTVTKKKDRAVWHCEAKSQRARGWVERVGKQNAMNGAIRQCNLRKVTNSTCKISNCYKL